MSKEAMDRINMAEQEAHRIVEKAQQDAERCFKQTEDAINKERTAFYERLKAQRSERLRRVDMQMKISEEKANIEATEAANNIYSKYERYLSRAADAAIDTVFGVR